MATARTVHPRCINASNPYHECTDYCLRKIANSEKGVPVSLDPIVDLPSQFGQQKKWKGKDVDEAIVGNSTEVSIESNVKLTEEPKESEKSEEKESHVEDVTIPENFESMNPMQKKLFEIRLKLNQARKANQNDVVTEKKRSNQADETRGISKKKWYDEKKRRMEKQLGAHGLDMSKAYMLETQEAAEAKYERREKKETPFGWDVFNQQSLYNAYEKRTKALKPDMEAYNVAKTSDPEFFRDDSSLKYGEAVKDPEENVERMVRELDERGAKRKEFSRRRKYHEDKDIDSINDRNEHFNRKIERAFGKYTVEIKNNLERGTALPE